MAKAKKENVDWAQRVADQFTKYIEENNTLPWLKGWTTNGLFPSNLQTKNEYRGINSLLLGVMGELRGYDTSYYLTIKGMRDLGGTFTDWEGDAKDAGLPIVFWKPLTVQDKETGKDKTIFFLRGWTVWNIQHMTGITIPNPERSVIDVPDAVANMFDRYENPPKIEHVLSASAHYSPMMDRITLPKIEQFKTLGDYAETKAHEGVHSTGHPSREARFEKGHVGGHEEYAKEELVAEIGAAILLQRIGVEHEMQRMADYVKGWGSRIKDDPKMLINAANKADKAVNRILGNVVEVERAA